MTKEEFERLEKEALTTSINEATQTMLDDIHNEGVDIFNQIIDFCNENDLEPDAVIQLITRQLSAERRKQLKKQGFIAKTWDVYESSSVLYDAANTPADKELVDKYKKFYNFEEKE